MIRIENLNFKAGSFILRDVSLDIPENSFFVLMGPTGAGKTVLLETMTGLIKPSSGKIILGNRDVTNEPPEKRGVGIVYQDYALFPHLTGRENIMFGTRYQKSNREALKRHFDELVDFLNISHLLDRYPLNYSGGELQRVALARALIVNPGILLLDEPLSALDQSFREDIRSLLKRLHETSRITFLMVTHDFSDALSLADSAAIMNGGAIVQSGSIHEIFRKPVSAFAADFVGMKNVFEVTFNGMTATTNGLSIELGAEAERERGFIAIRPEDVVISRHELDSSMRNAFRGRITFMRDAGFSHELEVCVDNVVFRSIITKRALIDLGLVPGLEVFLSFKASAVHSF